jgi:hypothetical protein
MTSHAIILSDGAHPQYASVAPAASAARSRLPDQITIQHGPPALLGRFFLKADAAARERGVSLSVAPLEELMEANRRNGATWKPLVPTFDPERGGGTAETGFAILGRDSTGDVVATQAARFFDWTQSDLETEFTSLRMHYANPAAWARPDEVCEISAPTAKKLGGRVIFTGGAWYRKDYRGKLLSMIMPRVGRTLAYTRWNIDYAIGMMADGVVAGGLAERCGFTNIEDGVQLWNSPMAPYVHGLVVWMPAKQLLDDLTWFLSSFETEVDVGVEHRRAQQA